MKAYHIEKARDLSDLPGWLFEEHERRPSGRPRFPIRQNSGEVDKYEQSPPRSRGLRDIYDAAAAPPGAISTTSGNSDRPTPNRFADGPSSKAADRLKALRDAKRQNSRSNVDPLVNNSGSREAGDDKRQRGQPRVGLPARLGGGPTRV
jgi:hypothetical protein